MRTHGTPELEALLRLVMTDIEALTSRLTEPSSQFMHGFTTAFSPTVGYDREGADPGYGIDLAPEQGYIDAEVLHRHWGDWGIEAWRNGRIAGLKLLGWKKAAVRN